MKRFELTYIGDDGAPVRVAVLDETGVRADRRLTCREGRPLMRDVLARLAVPFREPEC